MSCATPVLGGDGGAPLHPVARAPLAGLLAGLVLAGLGALAAAPGAGATAAVTGLSEGALAGLLLSFLRRLPPQPGGPEGRVLRWCAAGAAGPTARLTATAAAALLLLHSVALAGTWVDANFHHRLLSAALLTAASLPALLVAWAALRGLERAWTTQRWLPLGTVFGLALGLGLRVAALPSGARSAAALTVAGLVALVGADWVLRRLRSPVWAFVAPPLALVLLGAGVALGPEARALPLPFSPLLLTALRALLHGGG